MPASRDVRGVADLILRILDVIGTPIGAYLGAQSVLRKLLPLIEALAVKLGIIEKDVSGLRDEMHAMLAALRAELRDLEQRMLIALANKIDVTEYRAKTAELHTKINALELSLALLQERRK